MRSRAVSGTRSSQRAPRHRLRSPPGRGCSPWWWRLGPCGTPPWSFTLLARRRLLRRDRRSKGPPPAGAHPPAQPAGPAPSIRVCERNGAVKRATMELTINGRTRQLLVVRLPKTGTVVLTSDVVSFKENLTTNRLPAVAIAYRPAGFYEAYEWIRELQA